ncbi:uncharacterized protein C8A04DRAFT_28866 [Dichotomopilus funicola]|uniref:Uncharacterized protein n=1 Tax=Dichotomopilus funicola TaxID=1934379 RepID=A0AAN6V2V6_9PEZI|nr:hypothetical protein C8A04DRAFT_28866 [Dichotomopilus funicola]
MSQLHPPVIARDTRDDSRRQQAPFPIISVEPWNNPLFQVAAGRGTDPLQVIAHPAPAPATSISSSPGQTIPTANENTASNGILDTETWETTIDISAQGKDLVFFHQNLYYGLHTKIKCPEVATRTWDEDIKTRLSLDLIPVQECMSRKKKDSAVELDLRMSGTAQFGATTITLSPAIWILCGSQYCRKKIQKEVAKLTWLRVFNRYAIEIHRGAPILATSLPPTSVFLDNLDLGHPFPLPSSISNNIRLHIHLEDDEGSAGSGCGRLCCFTLLHNNLEPVQRFSRLGGMLDIEAQQKITPFGLTTAHGIHQLLVMAQARRDMSLKDSQAESDSDSDSGNEFEIESESAPSEGDGSDSESGDDGTDDLHLCCGSDSLLSSALPPVSLPNRYGKEGTGVGLFRQTVEWFDRSRGPFFNIVQILANAADPIEGRLLPDETYIRFGKEYVQTRKIELSAPLSTGTSGAWVVREGCLHGVIIAVYEREPYAHMITSRRLYTDIAVSLPGFDAANTSANTDDLKLLLLQPHIKLSRPTSEFHRNRALDEAEGRRVGDYGEKGKRKDSASRFSRCLVCPFYKRYPNSKNFNNSCKGGLDCMRRILEHIYACHPRRCTICLVSSGDGPRVCEHLRTATEPEDRMLSPDEEMMRVTQLQEEMSKEPGENLTDQEQWVRVFRILFPDVADDKIPSPYEKTMTAMTSTKSHYLSSSATVSEFRAFLEEDHPSRFTSDMKNHLHVGLEGASTQGDMTEVIRTTIQKAMEEFSGTLDSSAALLEMSEQDIVFNFSVGPYPTLL